MQVRHTSLSGSKLVFLGITGRWSAVLLASNFILFSTVVFLLWDRSEKARNRYDNRSQESNYVRSEAKNTISKSIEALNVCYKEHMANNPGKKEGSVKFDWLILTSGIPDRVELLSDGLGSKKLVDCVRIVITDMRFPPHAYPKPIYIMHQFNFGSVPKHEPPQLINTPLPNN